MLHKPSGDGSSMLCSKIQPPRHSYIAKILAQPDSIVCILGHVYFGWLGGQIDILQEGILDLQLLQFPV
jgi:hypothetical protein